MTPPLDENPFFPPDWRERVREFLMPFKDEDEEIENEYWFNVVRERTKRSTAHSQTTLRFGDIFLEREHRAYGAAGSRLTVVYARKSDFSSILQFWAYANLSANAIDCYGSPFVSYWFDFDIGQSQPLNATYFRAIVEHQWPIDEYALPAVFEEVVLQAWHYSAEWNRWTAVAETSDSFILWCWHSYDQSALIRLNPSVASS